MKTPVDQGVDQGRRRFARGGAAGSAVLLTLSSRSVLAAVELSCTGSALASGNLSRADERQPCGCSPGGWWESPANMNVWIEPYVRAEYGKTAYFNTVFGRPFFASAFTVLNDVGPQSNMAIHTDFASKCNGQIENYLRNVAMIAVAALLNAEFYGDEYPALAGYETPEGVIAKFQAACDAYMAASRCDKSAFDAFKSDAEQWNDTYCWNGKIQPQ